MQPYTEPVLDANGVETKVGDMVWSIESGNNYIVSEIYKDHTVYLKDFGRLRADEITHKEPDSLKKLQQFAVDSAAYADGCERDKFLEIADRLTALIERGA